MADIPRAERNNTVMRRVFWSFSRWPAFTPVEADESAADTALPNSPTKASPLKAQSMKIRLRVKDKIMTATLIDSKTTRDFVSLLPLTLTMKDLFRREKFAHLPRAISEE